MHISSSRTGTPYLTVPSDTPGTDSVTSRGSWHCPLRILIIRRASTSLRGALTEAHPRYVSWLNTTLSSSGMGLIGLPSDDDSSATMRNGEAGGEFTWIVKKNISHNKQIIMWELFDLETNSSVLQGHYSKLKSQCVSFDRNKKRIRKVTSWLTSI